MMREDLIYDVGMNNGDDTAYYLREGYSVVAIEANPSLCQTVARRFPDAVASGRLTILNVAISSSREPLPFWICEDHSEWSSFDRECAARDGSRHHAIDVEARTFSEILATYGVPYFLKVDIEGQHAACIDALDGELPAYISVEATDLDLLRRLEERGFTAFKAISQFSFIPLEDPPSAEQVALERLDRLLASPHPALRVARRLGLGRLVQTRRSRFRQRAGWAFPSGASGPFAEGTSGRWQTRAELERTYKSYLARMVAGEKSPFWIDRPYSFWIDFHAKR